MKIHQDREPKIELESGQYFLVDPEIGIKAKLYWPRNQLKKELAERIRLTLETYKFQKNMERKV